MILFVNFFVNSLILLALVAGHTQLVVAAINRLHALPIGCGPLKRTRHVHDVLILLFPPVLIGCVGLAEPAVLRGGSWRDLPIGWSVYFALCAAGLLYLIASAIRWQLRRPPALQASNHTETFAVDRELGRRPFGPGKRRYRLLAAFPGNEIFDVQFTEKTFHLPRLPAAWDGLSILHVSDLHFLGTIDRPYFEWVFERAAAKSVDLAVFTGDLCDNLALLDWLPATLGKLSAPLGRHFILGNHDWYLDPPLIRAAVERIGWTNVGGRFVTLSHRGHPLAIGGSEVPWIGGHPDFSTAPADAFRLFLSHTPDHLSWACEQRVDLMLSGHNHGGQIVLPIVGPVYSPSRFGPRYAAGTFFAPPTLLHVSRGLSGRYPLRWNCRPEVTRIVLRAPCSA